MGERPSEPSHEQPDGTVLPAVKPEDTPTNLSYEDLMSDVPESTAPVNPVKAALPYRNDITLQRIPRPDREKALSQLYISREKPEIVIRSTTVKTVSEKVTRDHLDLSKPDPELAVNFLNTTMDKLVELRGEPYNVAVPDMRAYVAQGLEAKVAGHIMTDKIYGTNIEYALLTDPLAREKIDTLGESITRYYLDKIKSDDITLLDIRPRQFIYGRKATDSESKAYLIDMDPYYHQVGENRLQTDPRIGKMLQQPISDWAHLAGSLGPDSKTYAEFSQLLTFLDEHDDYTSLQIEEWREFLNNSEPIAHKKIMGQRYTELSDEREAA